MEDKIKKICLESDNRIKIDKEKKIAIAKSKGYESFALYLYTEYKTRTASDILKELESLGIARLTVQTISNIKHRVQDDLKRIEPKISKGYCKKGCGRKIADDNWWYCKHCERDNKRVNIDREFYHIHI